MKLNKKNIFNISKENLPVFYGVLATCCQLLTAPITILIITRYLSPEIQGFYYTFASLIALRSFIELGLYVVVLNVASHEWAYLDLDEDGKIIGKIDAISRLVSLGRFVFKWYGYGCMLFIILVGIIGSVFLSQQSYKGIEWYGPWWSLVIISALLMWCLPFNSILEGCNQIITVQKYRLYEILIRNLVLWVAIFIGAKLWVISISAGASLIIYIYLLKIKFRKFFMPFYSLPNGRTINWLNEIFPMQWRLALGGIFSYFLTQLFSPVMFYYHGPAVAGQIGMTMAAVSAILTVSLNWMSPKAPLLGILISKKKYVELDALWWKSTCNSLIVAVFAALSGWLVVYLLNVYDSPIAKRLLPPLTTGIFLLTTIFMSLGYSLVFYLRAHKKEPLLILSIVTSIIMGLMVWGLGAYFGALGASIAYLIVMAGITLPWQIYIFLDCRRKWHTI
jgi:hypothetical protein